MSRDALLESMLTLSGDPLALLDGNGVFVVATPAFAGAYGGMAPDFQGRALSAAPLPSPVAAAVAAALPAVLGGGGPATAGGLLLRPVPDGAGGVGGVALSPVPPGAGGPDGRVWAERFVAVANHDLRQPFQAIQLFHHLLASRITEPMTQDLCSKLGEAIEGAETLIRAMMEVTSLRYGLVTAEPRSVPIDDILSRLLTAYEPKAMAKSLLLRVRPAEAAVLTDAALLERLLSHLVSNAVRFTDRGGVLLAARRRGGALRVEVWDTGPGMPEGDRPTLRDGDAPVGGVRGRGFGLTIVRHLAGVLDHPLSVCVRPGHGTMVAVTVPLAAS
ncbi:anti-sigma regulatory factor (Ser/Thr protein kinase) [Azospirillum fermentarium]|uniref:sensor histidine kinase n=1 Tax=Azospirillum fermentarium TaxID=1233114 RepID=UPI002227B381|nr:HAMP domain-containing sensor histidine kinase [Azospirillum fermentarium]MCW2245673.1 anti-sigma regulatory factor (Ser/Thr protein kinase) [Azospirillum fermentarium]